MIIRNASILWEVLPNHVYTETHNVLNPALLICILSNFDKEVSLSAVRVNLMVKDNIRLKYSGFLLFTSKILSLITGFGFVLMIMRSVSREEYGIWGNINDILGYFVLLAGIIPFWTTRFISREHAGAAKTGLVANIIISIASTVIYLALFPVIVSVLQIGSAYAILYAIVSVQIIQLYLISEFEAILLAEKPETIGYGLLIAETCKVVLGFIFIICLKLGMQGAIYTIIGATIVQAAFYMLLTANILKESVNWGYLKEWLKASPINLYSVVGNRIATFALIFLFMYGELARGYYQAALTVAGIVGYSAFLTFALYPKLLSKIDIEDVSTSFRMILMFAIPMTAGAIVLSDSYLAILSSPGKDYTPARMVLTVLAISSLVASISQIFYTIVVGVEKIDAKAKIPFKQLMKTRVFQVFTLSYIQSVIALPATFFALINLAKTQLEAATYLTLIGLFVELFVLFCRFIIARKCLAFGFPWKSMAKYIVASAVMVAILIILPHPERLLLTMGFTMLGAIVYLVTLAAIDRDTREMARSIMNIAISWLSKIKSK